jgi:hypothetical protein
LLNPGKMLSFHKQEVPQRRPGSPTPATLPISPGSR